MGPWRVLRVEEGKACRGLTVREKWGPDMAQASAYKAQTLGPELSAPRGLEQAEVGLPKSRAGQHEPAQGTGLHNHIPSFLGTLPREGITEKPCLLWQL